MRRKLFLLILLSMIFVVTKFDWIQNRIVPLGDGVVQTLSTKSSIELDPYGRTVDGVLTSPSRSGEEVDGVATISGSLRKNISSFSPYMWIRIAYLGDKKKNLPNVFHYYVPIREGNFTQRVRLFNGRGNYQVTVRVAGTQRDTYYPFSSFRIKNRNPSLTRDISYSSVAKEAGLHITAPGTGYSVQSSAIQLEGSLRGQNSSKEILIHVRKGKQDWQKVVSCLDSLFTETVPLLFGKGTYEVQVMLADPKRADYYLEGATLFINNQSNKKGTPIQYTKLYKERGIELSCPLFGGSHQDLTYRLAGRINPKGKDAKNTDHLVIRTTKGKDEAIYFIPVTDYHFDSSIYFRFGSGTYTVDVSVSENAKKRRDYFRFTTTAQFKVSVEGIQDVRDLIPSRGVNSNDVRIIRLANQLTKGKHRDLNKAHSIYAYVARSMTYDVSKLKFNTFLWNDNALKALQTKKGVCQDYVFLTLSLLRAAGIPSRFVEGSVDGQSHAWIESYVGNRWIVMDPTWGSGYIEGGSFRRHYNDFYFNPPITKLKKTHLRKGIIY